MEPERLIDDPETPAELSALLRRASRARPLDDGTRSRVRRHVVAAVAVPVGFSAVLSASSVSAAIGVASGMAVGAATIGVFVVGSEVADAWFGDPAPSVRSGRIAAGASAPRGLQPAAEAPSPRHVEEPPSPAQQAERQQARAQARPRDGASNTAAGLREESALLEAARGALTSAPARSLELAREHRQRFLAPRLAPERSLIEIEALFGLGRRAEGEALARAWLASGAGTLYETRVKRLLELHTGASTRNSE